MAVIANGVEYSYSNITFAFLGNTNVLGVKSISFKQKRESENLYGAGGEPIAIGYGNNEYEGEIQLSRKELMRMREANGNKSLTSIPPFDIVMVLANGVEKSKTITLRSVRILEDGMEGATGDKELPLTIPLALAGIVYS